MPRTLPGPPGPACAAFNPSTAFPVAAFAALPALATLALAAVVAFAAMNPGLRKID